MGIEGSQYLSVRYTERLAEAGIEQSVGGAGDLYDFALAKSIIGLFETEVIRPRCPWRGLGALEFATLDWVDWFNNRRILEPMGNRLPAETEAATIAHENTRRWPRDSQKTVSGKPGAVQDTRRKEAR